MDFRLLSKVWNPIVRLPKNSQYDVYIGILIFFWIFLKMLFFFSRNYLHRQFRSDNTDFIWSYIFTYIQKKNTLRLLFQTDRKKFEFSAECCFHTFEMISESLQPKISLCQYLSDLQRVRSQIDAVTHPMDKTLLMFVNDWKTF